MERAKNTIMYLFLSLTFTLLVAPALVASQVNSSKYKRVIPLPLIKKYTDSLKHLNSSVHIMNENRNKKNGKCTCYVTDPPQLTPSHPITPPLTLLMQTLTIGKMGQVTLSFCKNIQD